MQRILILIASVCIQLALGGVYAWSAFLPPLREEHALTGWQAGLIFGTTIAVFTITLLLAGRRLERVGPRRMAMLAGLIYGGGYLLAGSTSGAWPWLWLGIGVFSGIGIGMGYVCPLTTCVRWYPNHKGMVTGIAVAGFGGGAMVLAEVVELLVTAGWSPLRIFRMLGCVFAAIVFLCGSVLRFPGPAPEQAPPPSGTALWRDPRFLRLFGGMFGGTFGGLLVIGHLKPIALVAQLSSQAGAFAVSAFALGNALGRIVWGALYDRFGYRVVQISMAFLSFSLIGLLDTGVAWRFIGASFVAGFGFGACFVVFAAEVASTFGVGQVGRLYPKIFLAYGIAGIAGPLLGGGLYDLTGGYFWPVSTAVLVSTLGAASTMVGRRSRSNNQPERMNP